jgi:hypothetical protein
VKIVLAVVIIAFLAQYVWNELSPGEKVNLSSSSTDSVLAKAFDSRQSNLQVKGVGEIVKVLSDDRDGSRHQRFLLRLGSGQTLLVAHNIDLAPRVVSLAAGDTVEFFGEYEWNTKGGVIHWTHHDPQGTHVSGWLKHQGRTYK